MNNILKLQTYEVKLSFDFLWSVTKGKTIDVVKDHIVKVVAICVADEEYIATTEVVPFMIFFKKTVTKRNKKQTPYNLFIVELSSGTKFYTDINPLMDS